MIEEIYENLFQSCINNVITAACGTVALWWITKRVYIDGKY